MEVVREQTEYDVNALLISI